MTAGYNFSRAKTPKGYSFPLKRSMLDATMAAMTVTSLRTVYFRFSRDTSWSIWARYTGEQHRLLDSAGSCSLWVSAVPSGQRAAVEAIVASVMLPGVLDWMLRLERAGNVRRAVNHDWYGYVREGRPVIECA